MKNLTDEQLAEKYLDNEAEALEILIHRYLDPVYGFVFKYSADKDEAEDITQEIFIKVWKKMNSFNPTYKFKTWLFTIAKNTALDHIKRKKLILFSSLEKGMDDDLNLVDNIPDGNESPLAVLKNKERYEQLDLAFEKLPADYKTTLDLRYNQDLKFREIAELLNISIDTVKTRNRRAINRLKRLFLNN